MTGLKWWLMSKWRPLIVKLELSFQWRPHLTKILITSLGESEISLCSLGSAHSFARLAPGQENPIAQAVPKDFSTKTEVAKWLLNGQN
jgi:hypothetical protein